MAGLGDMAGGIGSGVTASWTGIVAGMQLAKAKRLRRQAGERPVMSTPQAELQNNAMARNQAGTYGLPGQGKIQNQLDADVANYAANLATTQQSPAAMAAGVLAAEKNKMAQDAKLGIQAANRQDTTLQGLMNENHILAGYEHDNWVWNKQAKWAELIAQSNALEGAGIQNAIGAVRGAGESFGQFAGGMGGVGGGGTGGQQFNLDTGAVMDYRHATGDYLSSDFEIMQKMYSSTGTPYNNKSTMPLDQ